MCILEIKHGQKATTVAQAVAHNLSTNERDLDFLRVYDAHYRKGANLEAINRASMHLHAAYRIALKYWECTMGDCTSVLDDYPTDEPPHQERAFPNRTADDTADLALGYQ